MIIDFQKLANKLKALTASNNHTEANLLLAETLGNEEAKEKLSAILKDQNKIGYLTQENNSERFLIYKGLLNELKAYGIANYNLIHSSL